jgi:hypothetical protein
MFASSLAKLNMLTKMWLPGFGLPYNDWGRDSSREEAELLSAVAGWNHDLMTVRERCMLFFINSITDKPKWYRKVHDKSIVAKWEREAKELDWSKVGLEHGDMSTKMLNYVSTLNLRHLLLALTCSRSVSARSVQRLVCTRRLPSFRF